MSFPSSFATQVAAIMDVLAKAAVAEITTLVEDGTVALRLEMRRRDGEIQELRRSLTRMEAELCRAQEAAAIRATEDKREQTAAPGQVCAKGEKEAPQPRAAYLERETADSLREPQCEKEENHDMRPAVKPEPEDELAVQDTDNPAAAAAANEDLIWSLPACSMSVQQDTRTFLSNAEHFSAHRDPESSYSSSTATQDVADSSASVPIKVEQVVRPLCMGSAASECVQSEHCERVSCPSVNRDHCLESALQQAGRSLVLPHQQSSTVNTEGLVLSKNNPRARRTVNVWRTNQKLFICSECNKGFLRSSQLEEHKATHQTFKPFRCLECGKSFTQKTRLKTHQSVHTGERPFSCKICGKMFSRQDNCLRHERFHSGVKPYSCGQCGKSFTVLGNLRIHQEIHLQGR